MIRKNGIKYLRIPEARLCNSVRRRYRRLLQERVTEAPDVAAYLRHYTATYQARLEDMDDTLIESEPHCWQDENIQRALYSLSLYDNLLIQMYVIVGLTQLQISQLMHNSQGAISSRLETTMARLNFWSKLPPMPDLKLWQKWFPMIPLFNKDIHVAYYSWKMFVEYAKDFHQIATAQRLGCRQCTVSLSLSKGLNYLLENECAETRPMIRWLKYATKYGPFLRMDSWQPHLSHEELLKIQEAINAHRA